MKFTLLIFSLLTRKPLQMTINEYAFNKKPTNLFSGYDQRYLLNSTTQEICYTCNATVVNTQIHFQTDTTTSEQIYNFKKMFAQLALLNYLKLQDESEINKLKAIENHKREFNDKPSEYKPNLLDGGLFKDWNFDIDK